MANPFDPMGQNEIPQDSEVRIQNPYTANERTLDWIARMYNQSTGSPDVIPPGLAAALERLSQTAFGRLGGRELSQSAHPGMVPMGEQYGPHGAYRPARWQPEPPDGDSNAAAYYLQYARQHPQGR
jgi:hypothetical protein